MSRLFSELEKEIKGPSAEDVIGGLLGRLLAILIYSLVVGAPIMFVWNGLMPVIFELPAISFWQGVFISAFCGLLPHPMQKD